MSGRVEVLEAVGSAGGGAVLRQRAACSCGWRGAIRTDGELCAEDLEQHVVEHAAMLGHAPAPTVGETTDELERIIRSGRYRYTTEDELQQGLAAVLQHGLPPGTSVQREVRLSARDRLDLLIERHGHRVAIEVKIDGNAGALGRQLTRYAEHPDLDALIVVTSRVRHLHVAELDLPIPVRVITLVGRAL